MISISSPHLFKKHNHFYLNQPITNSKMKIPVARGGPYRWIPYAPQPSFDTKSLDSGKGAVVEYGTRPPLKHLSGAARGRESHWDSEDDEKYKGQVSRLLDHKTYTRQQHRRTRSHGDQDFDLSKPQPRFVERLMEHIYQEIHNIACDATHNSENFDQAMVMGESEQHTY